MFRADLHIHSRYSRATSRKLTPRNLAAWAAVKGLDVLGTGDFTHSRWRDELAEALILDEESGLYKVRDTLDLAAELPEYAGLFAGPANAASGNAEGVRFMLQGEISSIYKRGGKVRKVHNLVFMPTLEAATRFSRRLAETGNLESDGRPILGLDSRDLLEMVLETAPGAFLVPAHIWTPWFSLFGSKSGFDTLEECYGDLASEIFALETGLSSDPEMNRLWSALDGYRLISNSDAHSGENLGREANLFSGQASYEGIYHALRGTESGTTFHGTLEFFPEEGKYHLDGHRKCNIALDPAETRALRGLCPACGKPLTVGVLHRVMELADRETAAEPENETSLHLIPLAELLGEILGTGPKSKKVAAMHAKAIERFGSELAILHDIPEKDIEPFLPPLAEGIARMRRGEVTRKGGYDGEYGTVHVFSAREKHEMSKGVYLSGFAPAVVASLSLTGEEAPPKKPRRRKNLDAATPETSTLADERALHFDLPPGSLPEDTAPETPLAPNPEQVAAAQAGPNPVLVLAGPGTGKTRTLVLRVEELLKTGETPRHILAVTFTRRAATEMDERLALALGEGMPTPRTDTLHALAFELWHKTHDEAPVLLSEEAARRVFAEANAEEPARLKEAWEKIALAREKRETLPEDLAIFLERYFRQKAAWNLADYTDLLEFWLEQIDTGLYTTPWTYILVDEIQDLSPLQLHLLKSLLPKDGKGFFGIGDPDQSIYGFRGATSGVREHLAGIWPELEVVALKDNYRSPRLVLEAASAVLGDASACGPLNAAADKPGQIFLFDAPSAESEAAWVAAQIRALIGQGSHSLDDIRGSELLGAGELSPGDIAILVRLRSQAPVLQKALVRQGIQAAVPQAEAFWSDPRVGMILREAGRILGISDGEDEAAFTCPDKVLAKGPIGLSVYLSATPPFDALFWQSTAFKALNRAFDTYGGWAGLINWVNLQTDLELVRSRSEHVQIMSMHAAKGLEFKAVFLPGLEDGLLPFAGAGMLTGQPEKDILPPDMDEERRLFYVGITRSQQSLFLSRAAKRHLFGKELRLKESRFLASVPKHGISHSALVAKQKRDETQLQLF